MVAAPQPACLDEATIVALVAGELDAKAVQRTEAHLADCSACREIVAAAASEQLASQLTEQSSRTQVTLPHPGQLIADKYRLERTLGRGGMGTVFAARHVELGHLVAIKVLHVDAEEATQRFLREAQTCARLGSDHILRVYDFGRLPEGAPFIVIEYLIGEDLARVVQRGPVPETQAVEYLRQACIALALAHAAGVVHRDLKPANLFLTERNDGSVQLKVLDFGISKLLSPNATEAQLSLTSTDTVLGSPLYMSPEQMHASRDVDGRSDIWSLGVILYELLTGRRPFQAPTLGALGMAIATETPPLPSSLVPGSRGDLDAIVMRCLEKYPAKRYASIAELAAALQQCTTQPTAATMPAPQPPRAVTAIAEPQVTPAPRSKRRLLLKPRRGVALALAAAGIAAWVAFARHDAPHITTSAASDVKPSQTTVIPRRSLAVLGFQNLNGEGGEDWISSALTQLLNAELGGGTDLRTISAERVALAKRDLRLGAAFAQSESLHKLQRNLRVDLVLLGSFLRHDNRVKVQLALKDSTNTETLVSMMEEGNEADLFEISQRIAARVRERLGLEKPSTEVLTAAAKTLPVNPEAARLYALGLVELYGLRSSAALALLRKAAVIEPDAPMLQSALARASDACGHDEEAKHQAARALELAGVLSRERRMSVKAQYHVTMREWTEAIDAYKALFAFYPDEVDYGIELASAQMKAGSPPDAMRTLDAIRALPAAVSDDPRLDYEEARSAHGMSDYERCLLASRRAIERGRERENWNLVARTGYFLGIALSNLGKPDEALAELERARDLAVEYGDFYLAGILATPISNQYSTRGDLRRAHAELETGLARLEEVGNDYFAASASESLARVEREQGQFEKAWHRVANVIAHYEKEGSWHALSTAFTHLADYEAQAGQLTAASSHAQQALDASRKIGRKHAELSALALQQLIERKRGQLHEQADAEQDLLDQARRANSPGRVAYLLDVIGERLVLEGDSAGARIPLTEALELKRSQKDLLGALDTERLLLSAQLREGQSAEVARQAAEKRAQLEQFGATTRAQHMLALEVSALTDAGQSAEAAARCEKADLRSEAWGEDSVLELEIACAATRCNAASFERVAARAERAQLIDRAYQAAMRWRALCQNEATRAPPTLTRLLHDASGHGFALR